MPAKKRRNCVLMFDHRPFEAARRAKRRSCQATAAMASFFAVLPAPTMKKSCRQPGQSCRQIRSTYCAAGSTLALPGQMPSRASRKRNTGLLLLQPGRAIPAASGTAVSRNPIDRFIQSRLASEGLQPADRSRSCHLAATPYARSHRSAAHGLRSGLHSWLTKVPMLPSGPLIACWRSPHYGERLGAHLA